MTCVRRVFRRLFPWLIIILLLITLIINISFRYNDIHLNDAVGNVHTNQDNAMLYQYDGDNIITNTNENMSLNGIDVNTWNTSKLISLRSPTEIHPYLLGYKETQLSSLINGSLSCRIRVSDGRECLKPHQSLISHGYGFAPAICFLSWRRFDLAAKLIYARYARYDIKSNWAKEVYLRSIDYMNGFCEGYDRRAVGADPNWKNCSKGSAKEFVDSFDSLLLNVRLNGFRITKDVPVDAGLCPIDGAHRVAAALAYGETVPFRIRKQSSRCLEYTWDYEWFTRRFLPIQIMDAMAIEFTLTKRNVFVIVLFPGAVGRNDEVIEALNVFSRIIYRRDLLLTGTFAPALFIDHCFPNMASKWRSEKRRKAFDNRSGYKAGHPTRVFLIESNATFIPNILKLIRGLFDVGEHSAYASETHADTLRLARLSFNENGIKFLNTAPVPSSRPYQRAVNLVYHFITLRSSIIPLDHHDSLCGGPALSLALHGKRGAPKHFPLLVAERLILNENITNNNEITVNADLENLAFHQPNNRLDDLIFHPHFYFHFFDMKILRMDVAENLLLNNNI